jgi:subtilisin family serine protease
VAVLDTGVNYNHPELSNDIIDGRSFVVYTYIDDNGHGTHVSGLITADGVNELVKGVAPDAKVWAGKVCERSGFCWESDIATAIEYVVKNKVAPVMSLSLGGESTEDPNCDNDYLAKKVNWASKRGTVVVVAAGNSGSGVSIPACASEAIAVGAVDGSDYVALFSGRGPALDLVAPGVSIYSSYRDNGYTYLSGTSMSTPMVSGSVALLFEKNSLYTVSQIKASLYNSAVDLGYSKSDQGFGRLNVNAAYDFKPKSHGIGSADCPHGKAKNGLC